ncbi:MAG: glycosyltransferase [Oligoflexia bacterium]|nr:glycosyltransferase [Oligoflexia bacterium]
MRILMVGKYYHPSHGGIETVLRNLAEGLRGQGDEVTVLCSAEHPRGADEVVDGVRVVRAATLGKLFSQPLNPGLPGALRRLSREHELIHVHSPNPLAEASTLAFAGRDKPLVVTYHSDIVRQRLFLPAYAPLVRAFLARAARVGVGSRSQILHSPFLRGMAERCDVIPYGIDPRPYEPLAATLARAAQLRAEIGRFLLFVGRLVSYKGVPVLIEAMSRLRDPEARLVILGAGPLRAELEESARRLGVLSRVRFTGSVAEGELQAYYHASELLVLPSINKAEAFGLVQVEAMACGKPIVATRLDSGVTEVGVEGVTGLQVAAGDPADLARAIDAILGDEARRLEMGRAARRRFEERFTRERMVTAYRELYRRIISS